MKRNLIEEIVSLRERRLSFTYFDFNVKKNRIEKLLENLPDTYFEIEEALKYSTINIVACAEALFKDLVKDLIDNNEDYYQNITQLIQSKSLKLDFTLVSAFQSEKITVGDLVSHILSYNNLDDLLANFYNITNKKLIDEISKNDRLYIYENFNEIIGKFKSNQKNIIKSIQDIYTLRHILCHEYGNQTNIDYGKLREDLNNFLIFLEGSYIAVQEMLEPNFPESTEEINKKAINDFQKIETEFDAFVKETKKNFITMDGNEILDIATFEKLINEWKEYANDFSRFMRESTMGGTMYQSTYLSYLEELYKHKFIYLKKIFPN